MGALYGWAREQKVFPGLHPIGIYFDDPQLVPGHMCRSHIAITYRGEGQDARGVRTRRQPAMKVASLSFKGPGRDLGMAHHTLARWIENRGHIAVGPSIEIYSRRPEIIDDVIILYSKIMMQVEPSQG